MHAAESFQNSIFRFADDYLEPYRVDERRGQIQPRYCPVCGGGDRRDRNTFALNIATGQCSCLRGSCGWHGSFADLVAYVGAEQGGYTVRNSNTRSQNFRMPDRTPAVQYAAPKSTIHPRTPAIDSYLAARKLTALTLDAYMIAADSDGNILFPFYEDGRLVYVKHRRPQKVAKNKEWQDPDTKPVLFGMDLCDPDNPLIITEGQLDAMSCFEAGLPNAVSVPCGCENLDWITHCWTFLEKFDQVILFGDNDDPGRRMIDEIVRRLGESRCIVVEEYPTRSDDSTIQCKDANEILYFRGPEAVSECVRNATLRRPRGVLDLADVEEPDLSRVMRIKTNIPKLDKFVGGLEAGTLTVCTGSPGAGKSTVFGQMALEAVQQGHNVCIYSGEMSAFKMKNWLTLQSAGSEYIGLRHDDIKGAPVPYVDREVARRISDWFRGRIYLFDNRERFTCSKLDAIMEVFDICAKRYGCDVFICDNVLTATSDAEDENREQNKFMVQMNDLCIRHKAAGIVIAHARKVPVGQDHIRMNDISGNSVISKLASTILVIEKPDIRIIKARDEGRTALIRMAYCADSRRVYQADVGDRAYYGWDRTGLAPVAIRADSLPEYQVQLAPEPV